MKMLLFVFLFAFSDASPGYSGSSSSGNDIGQGSTGGGNSYGYAGSFSGSDGFPPGNFPAFVPVFPQFDFSSFFEQLNRQHLDFIKQLQKHAAGQAQAGTAYGPGNYAPAYQGTYSSNGGYGGSSAGTGASAGGSAPGGSGGGFGLGNRGGFVGGYGGGFSGPDGNSFSFSGPLGEGNGAAFASGSIGPGGAHQTASVYPENPGSPNVNTRFGGDTSGGGGFKSVFTSSKSVTNNVDGKPQTFRQASTTINDNGKVTTYTAHNP